MTKEEFVHKIRKPAIKFQVGGFRPVEDLTASWIGNITVKGVNESWPEFKGQPMIPICQLNLSEFTNKPNNLKDIELLTLFLGANELPKDKPNGQGWLLRTYKDITKLEEIEKPNFDIPVKAFQLKPEPIANDFPCWEDCPIEVPQEFEESYYDLFPNQEGIKIGGWPTLVQSEIFWAPLNQHLAEPEFVLQVDSIEKANLYWGDNGVAYIGRGTKPESKDEWSFSWQSY